MPRGRREWPGLDRGRLGIAWLPVRTQQGRVETGRKRTLEGPPELQCRGARRHGPEDVTWNAGSGRNFAGAVDIAANRDFAYARSGRRRGGQER